jgi:hypothetical protein
VNESSSKRDGVIFVATGAFYIERAEEAARSVRRTNPQLGITLMSDSQPRNTGLFDIVVPIDNSHARSKVDNFIRSPYERTLYLDSDTRVLDDLTSLFSLLDQFDLAATHVFRREALKHRPGRPSIPSSFPQLNSAVVLYRKSETTDLFFSKWSEMYHQAKIKYDQVTFRELLWTFNIRFYVLPPEYNIRYRKYLWVWSRREAKPKIVHFFGYHRKKQHLSDRLHNILARRILGLELD